jgi:hypothetical protein
LPAADASIVDFLDAAELVDNRRRSPHSARIVIVDHVHDAKLLGQLEHDAQLDDDHVATELEFEPVDVVQHDELAVGHDVFFIRDDVRFRAPKIELASVTSVVDGSVPQRPVRDRITGNSCRLDETPGCAEAVEGETGTSRELRKHRRTCVHWIRVRGCARAHARQHRPLRLNALASSLQPARIARFEYGSLPWQH